MSNLIFCFCHCYSSYCLPVAYLSKDSLIMHPVVSVIIFSSS